MSKPNGIKDQTTLCSKEQKSRHCSSALPTFLKWFKKDSKYSNNRETLNSTKSASLGKLSSSSCDSIISTSTTGFAYIKPSNYRPDGIVNERKLFVDSELETDIFTKHMKNHREENNLTLRTKYHLYAADTLHSNDASSLEYKNTRNFDRSLPNVKSKLTNERSNNRIRRHRRTVSDSSKEKRSGAYVHVKGKRKAPQPPNSNVENQNCNKIFESISSNCQYLNRKNTITSSPASTINKKKRKAPPPPPLNIPKSNVDDNFKFTSSESFFNDNDIKAILGSSITANNENFTISSPKMDKQLASTSSSEISDYTNKLSDTQKQTVMEKVIEAQTTKTSENILKNDLKHNSPISPRPWYKRPISYNRESSIPFKREVVLKTMEKRKQKQKEKSRESTTSSALPEVGYSRSSIFDAGHKFGFFLRHKENSNDTKSKDKEKRRSGIGIPNISELDREAAAIINEEHANARKAQLKLKDENFTKTPDQVILQQQMFVSKINTDPAKSQDTNEEKSVSTKDLIFKFESDSNTSKVFLNTSFIGRPDLFSDNNQINPELNSAPLNLTKEDNQIKDNNQDESQKNDNQVLENFDLKDCENSMPKLSWNCPVCTLENPSWRIMCELCEKLKPFEKFEKLENKLNGTKNKTDEIHKSTEKLKETSNSKAQNRTEELENRDEWDKKTEKVMKYFKPRQSGNALSKSSSESILGRKQLIRKSPSPSKLPIGSPKLNVRSRSRNLSHNISEELENTRLFLDDEIKKPLIDSSVVVTTVTPVFYASKNIDKNIDSKNEENNMQIDLKEVRNARILKFTPKENNISNQSSHTDDLLNDPNFLEMEKKRLREKIRAMNAKALTEKYPILQKTISFDGNNPTSSDKEQETSNQEETKCDASQGAIKKIPQNRVGDNLNISTNGMKSTQANYDLVGAALKPKKVSASAQTPTVIKKDKETDSKEIELNNTTAEITLNNKDTNRKETIKEENLTRTNASKYEIKIPAEAEKQNTREKSKEHNRNKLKPAMRYFYKEVNRTDTIALNKIMRNLELAIAEGNDELAAKIAMDLAKLKVSLHVTKTANKNQMTDTKNNQSIKINVLVEDKTSIKRSIQLEIEPQMTIKELKQKVSHTFNYPIEEQRWFINSEIVNDDLKTLSQYNIVDNSVKFDLKLIPVNIQNTESKSSKLIPTKAVCEDIDDLSDDDDSAEVKLETNQIGGAAALPLKIINNNWQCPLCTLINPFDCNTCSACSKARPQQFYNENDQMEKNISKEQIKLLNPLVSSVLNRLPENKNDLNKANLNRKSAEIFNIIDETITKVLSAQIDNQKNIFHFSSPNITKYKYRGVDNFNPNRKSIDQTPPIVKEIEIKQTKTIEPDTSASSMKQTKNNHYLELLDLENSDIVLNIDIFECPICFMRYEPGEGVILRDCLHTFCKECLVNTVQYSDDAEVKCPYIDAEYSCTSVLQEREIKTIVTKDIYELHLAKSVRVAEHQIENTFHCKTPNCRGWCIYEDNVNQFKCPVCKITNCLTCRVIHDGLSCKQYQDRLNSDCDSNLDARRTKEMLREMVEKGEAMNCPTCQVVLMKKWGCDWLKCSMCKTEICWVTRGPRWGPGGKGDTSAGCKCGVDGKKCHPKCNYCH